MGSLSREPLVHHLANPADEPAALHPGREDSLDLAHDQAGLRSDEATLGREMDWSAVASLLAERGGLPAVLLADTGRLLLVAPAAESALGWRGDSVGSDWLAKCVAPGSERSARWLLTRALSGALRRFDVEILTASGRALATFEACPVGGQNGRGLLLLLEKLVTKSLGALPGDYDYEVTGIADGAFLLGNVSCFGSSYEHRDGRCYEVLHGRSSHCDPCPLRSADDVAWPRTAVSLLADGEYQLTSSLSAGTDRARLSVRRLPIASLAAIVTAKLDGLAGRARLSARERAVFGKLVEGRALEEIAQSLSISQRTVKFHQSNLLEKLGADSRADLLRLIF